MIGDLLPKYIRKWLEKKAFKYPNVIGYSYTWMPREKNKVLLWNKPVVRFYVSKKLPVSTLGLKDLIKIELRHWLRKRQIESDVVEIGEVRALVDKTKRFRPVELGVSVGNEAISAGSLGMLYISSVTNEKFCGSNAHVLCDGDPSKPPKEIRKKNILQPGSYHGGRVPTDVVGQYEWHQQIYPMLQNSNCKFSKACISILNFFSERFGRKTRFKASATEANTIDFAIYKPTIEHLLKIADNSIDFSYPFIGHLFAGSETSGVICKYSEISKVRPDLLPKCCKWSDVDVGDKVRGCSFWCNFETEVLDADGVIQVNFGSFLALFQNVVIVKNNGTIKGGWSGSGWFKVS